jgi:hypothetical protein
MARKKKEGREGRREGNKENPREEVILKLQHRPQYTMQCKFWYRVKVQDFLTLKHS